MCIVLLPAPRQKLLDSTQWKKFSVYKNYKVAAALMAKAHDQKSCRKNTSINDSQTTTNSHLQSYIYTMNRMTLMNIFSIFSLWICHCFTRNFYKSVISEVEIEWMSFSNFDATGSVVYKTLAPVYLSCYSKPPSGHNQRCFRVWKHPFLPAFAL